MTNIEDLFPAPSSVTVNGKDFPVQALNLEQVALLLSSYKFDLLLAFSDSVSGELNFPALVGTAPNMVSEVISYGLGLGLESAQRAKQLPLMTQISILEKVWDLTVPEPKKLYGLLFGAMAGLQHAGLGTPTNPENSPTEAPSEELNSPASSQTQEEVAPVSTESSPA